MVNFDKIINVDNIRSLELHEWILIIVIFLLCVYITALIAPTSCDLLCPKEESFSSCNINADCHIKIYYDGGSRTIYKSDSTTSTKLNGTVDITRLEISAGTNVQLNLRKNSSADYEWITLSNPDCNHTFESDIKDMSLENIPEELRFGSTIKCDTIFIVDCNGVE